HHPHQRLGGLLQRNQREAALRQRRRRVALGQAGVDETEPAVGDAERAGGGGHLLATDLVDAFEHAGGVHGRIEDAATFAAGQRHDEYFVSLVGVTRGRRGTLACFVVMVVV